MTKWATYALLMPDYSCIIINAHKIKSIDEFTATVNIFVQNQNGQVLRKMLTQIKRVNFLHKKFVSISCGTPSWSFLILHV